MPRKTLTRSEIAFGIRELLKAGKNLNEISTLLNRPTLYLERCLSENPECICIEGGISIMPPCLIHSKLH